MNTIRNLCIEGSQLSDAAIRDDGTVFVVVTRNKRADLVGLDGQNGTVRYQINLGYSEPSAFTRLPSNTTAPIILEDETVIVGVHRFIQRGFDRSNSLHVVGLSGDDLGIDRPIWIDGVDPQFLFGDLQRLIPDNKGGLLLATVGMVFRIGSDNVMSNSLELRINEAPYFADEIDYVVADDAIYAMIHHQPTFYNRWEGARLVTFDPVTLTEMGSEFLTGSRQPHLDFSFEGGGVSWSWDASNATQVGPQLSAGWQPNPVIQTSDPVSLGEASWRFPHANVQESNKVKGLHSNYNAVDVITDATPDEVFTTLIATYYGVSAGTQALLTGAPVTGVGQTLTFYLSPPLGLGHFPFDVKTVRFDPSDHVIAAETARNHPLSGWRFWHVFSTSATQMRIETGALDHPSPGWLGLFNQLGFWLTKSQQIYMWEEYLRKIVEKMQQSSTTIIANSDWIVGKWDVFPKEYIRTQICGPYPFSPAPLLCGPQ